MSPSQKTLRPGYGPDGNASLYRNYEQRVFQA